MSWSKTNAIFPPNELYCLKAFIGILSEFLAIVDRMEEYIRLLTGSSFTLEQTYLMWIGVLEYALEHAICTLASILFSKFIWTNQRYICTCMWHSMGPLELVEIPLSSDYDESLIFTYMYHIYIYGKGLSKFLNFYLILLIFYH